MDKTILKPEEQAIFELRSLYRSCGYLPFKMTKFEEYDLYVRNKDFLVSDSIITFNDTNGRLLALKPDVTLSIIKNFRDEPGCVEKVYYNENVYRLSSGTHEYQEIPQTGLECIGNIDLAQILEVTLLAARSLRALGDDWVLSLSHMGIVSALMCEAGVDGECAREIMRCLGEKNRHELESACGQYEVEPAAAERLAALIGIYGDVGSSIASLRTVCTGDKSYAALGELERLCGLLAGGEMAKHICIDFSIVNDMSYYNGFVFRGYLRGIPEGVLSGGQYDRLMRKFGSSAGGIGFAVYLDLLERYRADSAPYDVDVVLLYGDSDSSTDVMNAAQLLRGDGSRVLACRKKPAKLLCRRTVRLRNGEVTDDE